MNNRISSLDLLRAIAIFCVLLLHSLDFLSGMPGFSGYIFSFGWVGVDLFFVLSGFLIGLQAFQQSNKNSKQDSIKRFLIKRWFRTLPLYYIVLIVYVFIKPIFGYPFTSDPKKFIFLIQNFYSPKDFVQSWSLCIEEQFYLVFPIIFFSLKPQKNKSIYWLIPGFLSMFYRFFLYQKGVSALTPSESVYHYQFPFFTHLDSICWGIFLASSFDTWSKFKNKHYFLILGVISLFLSLSYIGPSNLNSKVILSFQLLAFSFSLILIGVYDIKNIPFSKLIELTALWSYGLYLWNNLVVKIIIKLGSSLSNFTKIFLFFFLTFLISSISYYFIEKPCLKLRNKALVKTDL